MSITIPFLSLATIDELDEAARDIGCRDFAGLVSRCRACDDAARAQGGSRGWRPSGPDTLALRLALDVVSFLEDVELGARLRDVGRAVDEKLAADADASLQRMRAKLGLDGVTS